LIERYDVLERTATIMFK